MYVLAGTKRQVGGEECQAISTTITKVWFSLSILCLRGMDVPLRLTVGFLLFVRIVPTKENDVIKLV